MTKLANSTNSTTYTRDEANQRLPLIKSIAADLVVAWGTILDKRNDLEAFVRLHEVETIPQETIAALQSELETLIQRVNACVAEIQQLGGSVVELRRGAVAIPSELNGQPVVLSWLPGEPEFGHYYKTTESLKNRRPLSRD